MTTSYEQFTPEQEALLGKFVTNTKGPIFVLRNLPEVIKGALFSRYSRSTLGLKSLLLKEFINNSDETNFDAIAQTSEEELDPVKQQFAIKKAQNFYDRILDGYGDDSIGELGGAHLAVENVSMLAAKAIEDCRIGGSPLEKSTRYIYFDQKVNGEYLYYREPILMTSAWKSLYISTCDMLFDTYSKMIPVLTEYMEKLIPQDANSTKTAYTAAIRAKVLDCIRGLLPAGTLTNIGIFGNGRFFEFLLHKLQCNPLAELQEIGKVSYDELSKVIPSFVRRSEPKHKYHLAYQKYFDSVAQETRNFLDQLLHQRKNQIEKPHGDPLVSLISHDPDAVYKVAASLLFSQSDLSTDELEALMRLVGRDEIGRLFDSVISCRENRRHKSPRALERAQYTFEFVVDFGTYRDLQRHRMLTQERQLLSCSLGYYIPQEVIDCGLQAKYKEALDKAKEAYDTISKELPEEAQYIVPMAYKIRWYETINLRTLQWMCELRSQPAGHPSYRKVARILTDLVCKSEPLFEKFFRFVDHSDAQTGRLQQEISSELKRTMLLQDSGP